MSYFIDEIGTYFEGDIEYERSQGRICTEVPQSPGRFYKWIIDKWVLNTEKVEAERTAEVDAQIRSKLPELMRIIALDDTKGFEDLKAEIKAIDK